MQHLHLRLLTATLPFLLSMPYGLAQPVQPPTRAEAQAALNPPPAPARFTKVQLDQMLAPIALYPDQLLTQLLMAATFPDQLVDAAKWLQDGNNGQLKGDDLANALQPLPWDPSVKSLVAFPQLIAMLTTHLDWTEALGTAFANQEVEVFSRVQFLRERAKQAGQLKSTSQIAVREQDSDIIIEPAEPNMIYVPVYNPAVVYGDWPDRDAPPVYIPPPPALYSGAVGAGIAFSAGLGVVAPLWGWGHPDWHRHTVVVDPGRYQRITSEPVIRQNHVTVEQDTWHRSGPVALVPEGRRPAPPQATGQQPAGTIRPSEFAHREFGPNGRPGQPPSQPGSGPQNQTRPAEAQPGQPGARPGEEHPAGEPRRGEQHGAPAQNETRPAPPQQQGQPSPHPGEQHGAPAQNETRPAPPQQQGQPGPHPGEQHPAQEQRGGQPHGEQGHAPPQNEAHPAPQQQQQHGQPGPHPGEQHPAQEERGGQPHGEQGHAPPQNEAHPPQPQAQPGPHPGGQPQPSEGPRPERQAEPPHPQGGQQGEQHPPQPPPQQHAAPQQEQHPQGPPPQAAHPQGPGPQQQQQQHQGGQPQQGEKKGDKKGDEDKH